MWAGTGVSGLIVPLVMSWGLERFGFRTMLRAWAILLVLLSTPLLYFVKPRLPVLQTNARRKVSYAFVLSPTFLLLQVGNILEGLGYFIPSIYLPSYAHAVGLDSKTGALTVSLFNMASVLGVIMLGFLGDRLHVTTVTMIATLGAVTAVFGLWSFAQYASVLYLFALMYGFFAGGYSTTWTGIMREVKKVDEKAEAVSIFGLLAAGRGIGAVSSGPLSEALLSKVDWQRGYGALIIFTGITAALGATGWVGKKLRLVGMH